MQQESFKKNYLWKVPLGRTRLTAFCFWLFCFLTVRAITFMFSLICLRQDPAHHHLYGRWPRSLGTESVAGQAGKLFWPFKGEELAFVTHLKAWTFAWHYYFKNNTVKCYMCVKRWEIARNRGMSEEWGVYVGRTISNKIQFWRGRNGEERQVWEEETGVCQSRFLCRVFRPMFFTCGPVLPSAKCSQLLSQHSCRMRPCQGLWWGDLFAAVLGKDFFFLPRALSFFGGAVKRKFR